MNLGITNAATKKTTPRPNAVVRHPKLSGLTAQARIGTSASPPTKLPSPAIETARERFRANHLLTVVISGSQVPAADPSIMRAKER